MIDERFSRDAFDSAVERGLPALTALLADLEDEVVAVLRPALERAFADVAAGLRQLGHELEEQDADDDYPSSLELEWSVGDVEERNLHLWIALSGVVMAGYRGLPVLSREALVELAQAPLEPEAERLPLEEWAEWWASWGKPELTLILWTALEPRELEPDAADDRVVDIAHLLRDGRPGEQLAEFLAQLRAEEFFREADAAADRELARKLRVWYAWSTTEWLLQRDEA